MLTSYGDKSITYDAIGNPQTLNHNGTVYYYVTNLQGDVISIVDGSGNIMVSYSYDAWGNHLSISGTSATTIGILNPLRYRGYVYDHETGLYYLQSRYYNPTIGRFLNADALASTGQGELGNNMFAYCLNNPVMLVDSSGMAPFPTTVAIDDSGRKSVEKVTDKEWKMYFLHGLLNFVYNTSEEEVLAAEYFAFYKGVPVIKVPFMGKRAFSFGAIFMGNDVEKTSTVRHEYGHAVHFRQIGPVVYYNTVAIPSLWDYWTGTDNYHSEPQEYIADMLGQVDPSQRTYLENADKLAFLYYLYTRALAGR